MRPVFQNIASRWLTESAGSVSPQTIGHYRWLLENYVCPRLGEREVSQITEEDVQALVEEKREQGFSAASVYPIPKLVSRILSFASSEGLCEAPEWDIIRGKPEKASPTIILTSEQERRLLAYLTDNASPRHLAIYLILTAGLSMKEVLSLTWADVSFPLKRIRVLMEKEGAPGTRKKFRDIPLHERQLIYLKKMQSLPTVYLVSGKPKKPWPGILTPVFRTISQELGFPELSAMDLRRTFAVHTLENGMGYEQLGQVLGQENSTNFRSLYRELVSPETRGRLEQELLATRKPRQAPEHIDHIGPDLSPEVVALRQKVEAKKRQLQETLDSLEGDLEIIHTLRNNDLHAPGRPREGLYRFIEKVLGEDRDGQMLVEYLRCNMRVADMPSRKEVSVQAIRSRIARGFAKLNARLDEIYAVEGYDILDMFHTLTSRIQEMAPPAPKRPGPRPKPTLESEFRQAMEALERLDAE